MLSSTGKTVEAGDTYTRILDIASNQHGQSHPEFARALNDLGVLEWKKGRYEAAEGLYRRALGVYESLGGEAPGVEHADAAAPVLSNLAALLCDCGRHEVRRSVPFELFLYW